MTLAPLAGGYLNQYFGFQANFTAILLVVTISFFVCLFGLKESLLITERQSVSYYKLKNDFKRVLTSFSFWQMNLSVCLLYGVYMAFLSISALFFVVELGVSKVIYPYFQVAVLGGWLSASLICPWLLNRWSTKMSKKIGCIVLICSLIGFQTTYLLAPRDPYGMTFFMVTFAFGYNWLQTPYFGEIMNLMPDIKGILGSILTSFRLLLTAIVVAIVGAFYDHTISSFVMVLWGITFVIAPMIWLREKQNIAKAPAKLTVSGG